MSTKEKTAETDEATGEGRQEEADPDPRSSSSLAAAGAAYFFLFSGSGEAEAAAPEHGEVRRARADRGQPRRGRLPEGRRHPGDHRRTAAGGGHGGAGVDGAKATDLIISTFSQAQPADVTGARDALKEALEQKIIEAYTEDDVPMVMDIYYTEYVTQ